PEDIGPRLVKYDPSKRVVGIVSRGFNAQIARPSNGRRGRIARPSNAHIVTVQPVVAVAKFGRKGKVTSRNVFSADFADQGGLSELLSLQDNGEWLTATYSGKLFSIATSGDFERLSPRLIGELSPRIERLDYLASRDSLVAVQSCAAENDGFEITQPGSVAIGKLISADGKSLLAGAAQLILPGASSLVRRPPAIRRPCNIKR
ncbi:MAG TPA: hypothetical protein VLU47_06205, partial [Blastocatellia bacterium]|nr:hypothetical protein [Blastocatellia bacterium]